MPIVLHLPDRQVGNSDGWSSPLEVREVAAVDLVARGLLDPRDALALVAWPSGKVAAASVAAVGAGRTRKLRPEKERLRALELVDAGWSWAAAGREVGAPKSTVGTWLKKRSVA